jgi:hypothetical protein
MCNMEKVVQIALEFEEMMIERKDGKIKVIEVAEEEDSGVEKELSLKDVKMGFHDSHHASSPSINPNLGIGNHK